MGEIIDVFAGAGKMDKLRDCGQFFVAGNRFFQKVLDRFDVMVCGRLDCLNALCVGFRKATDQSLQEGACLVAEGRHLRYRGASGELF